MDLNPQTLPYETRTIPQDHPEIFHLIIKWLKIQSIVTEINSLKLLFILCSSMMNDEFKHLIQPRTGKSLTHVTCVSATRTL